MLLQPRAATTLGMVFHELATNAVKYGAFANPLGRLLVEWDLTPEGDGRALVVTWREAGGSTVAPPQQKGLGSELIVRSLDFELNGSASIDYLADGIVATLTMPVTPYLVPSNGGIDRAP
jgi:two-component sensor histidine kinase